MRRTNGMVQIGAAWFAIASFLMALVLVLHGPIAPDLAEQMTRISRMQTMWSVAHWIAAAGLSLHAVAALVVLTSHSRLTVSGWTTTAWAVIPIAAIWTLTTAVAEATVVASAAQAGNRDVFEAWWAFAEGKATGFSFLALAVALIAAHDARSADRATPAWAGLAATLAALASFAGWALGMWFGFRLGNVVWLVASMLMSAWCVWFGVAVARSNAVREPA